jgi:hypothetical protein
VVVTARPERATDALASGTTAAPLHAAYAGPDAETLDLGGKRS